MSYNHFLEWCTEQDNDLARKALVIANNEDDTNRSGHIMRGFLASVPYLKHNPDILKWLASQPRTVNRPVNTGNDRFCRSWNRFLKNNRRQHEILRRILPGFLGGQTTTGGGGAYPFKIALRLAADYVTETYEEAAPVQPDPKYRMVRRKEFDRDYPAVNQLKARYDHACQICHTSMDLGKDRYYCEAHHLRPLGRDHNGRPDVSNVVILCPNHHAEFDHFLFAILDFKGTGRALEHIYRKLRPEERSITVKHRIAPDSLDYVIEQFLTRLDLYFKS